MSYRAEIIHALLTAVCPRLQTHALKGSGVLEYMGQVSHMENPGLPAPELLHRQRPSNPTGMSVFTCLSKYDACLIIVRKISMRVNSKRKDCLSRNNFSKVPFKGTLEGGVHRLQNACFAFSNQPHDAPKLTFRSGSLERELLTMINRLPNSL